MIAHSLVEPDMRHSLEFMTKAYLGYSPIPVSKLVGDAKSEQVNMADVPVEKLGEFAAEGVDLVLQLRSRLESGLKERGQERVFYEIELPLMLLPLPSWPLLPVPQFQTEPSFLAVCMRPAAIAFTLLKKDSATTVLKELAELFEGSGSGGNWWPKRCFAERFREPPSHLPLW